MRTLILYATVDDSLDTRELADALHDLIEGRCACGMVDNSPIACDIHSVTSHWVTHEPSEYVDVNWRTVAE